MNNILYFVVIILLIIILIHILPFNNNNYYENNESFEGFTIPGLSDMNDSIDKVNDIANSLPKEINNIKFDIEKSVNSVETIGKTITSEIDGKLSSFLNQVETLITTKFKKFFTQFGDILNNGIVKPIIGLFEGTAYIILAIFDILKEIGNKIISLPGCIIIYMVKSFLTSLYFIYTLIIPEFIRQPIDYIYNFLIKTPIDYIFNWIGLTSKINKCYSFNIQGDLDKMNKQLTNINTSFKKDFGNLDFNSITL